VQLPRVRLHALHTRARTAATMSTTPLLALTILAVLSALLAITWTRADTDQLSANIKHLRERRAEAEKKKARTP
jgi:hypothetical protein